MDIRLVKAMVIGDGSLDVRSRSNVNARFKVNHGVKQKDYLLWKRDLLAASGLNTWYGETLNTINPHTGKKGILCWMESGANPVLTVLRDLLYPKSEGFKPGVLDDLEALHLAIIFMDDGGKQVNKKVGWYVKGRRVTAEVEPYIASYCFSLQSHGFAGANQFCDWLNTKFGINAKVWTQKGQPKVAICRNDDKERFRTLIAPFIHPCVAYKLDGTVHARVIHRERLSERTPEEVRAMRQSELAGNELQEGEPKSLPASE
jgi:hypothetical protein